MNLENGGAVARREKREIHSIHEEDQSIDEQSGQARIHGWTFLSNSPWRYVPHENIDASFSFLILIERNLLMYVVLSRFLPFLLSFLFLFCFVLFFSCFLAFFACLLACLLLLPLLLLLLLLLLFLLLFLCVFLLRDLSSFHPPYARCSRALTNSPSVCLSVCLSLVCHSGGGGMRTAGQEQQEQQ